MILESGKTFCDSGIMKRHRSQDKTCSLSGRSGQAAGRKSADFFFAGLLNNIVQIPDGRLRLIPKKNKSVQLETRTLISCDGFAA